MGCFRSEISSLWKSFESLIILNITWIFLIHSFSFYMSKLLKNMETNEIFSNNIICQSWKKKLEISEKESKKTLQKKNSTKRIKIFWQTKNEKNFKKIKMEIFLFKERISSKKICELSKWLEKRWEDKVGRTFLKHTQTEKVLKL